ncbi:MAG TPA: DUF4010 domain-containing protein [Steroidobacteraceae bacterium]|nr:DUF4010 domain-containing protein [Steroidobacteraceae bacterium]
MLDGRTSLEVAGRVGLALGMAVFMGLAFEGIYKREERASPGGIRTFPMLAILGSLLYLIGAPSLLPYVIGLGAVAVWLYAYMRLLPAPGADRQPTLMIPTANLLAYALGPTALTQPPWLVVSAAVAAVILLESRDTLHRVVLQVAPDEVFTLGKFLILVGIILPLMPNGPIVSWTPITPLQVWLALVAVSTLSYLSYLLQRYLPKSGPLVPSMLGGAYSSTATTVALAREQKTCGEERPELTVGIVIATAIMYVRIDVVVALFNWRLAWVLLPPLAGLFVLAAATAAWQWRRRRPRGPAPGKLPVTNPLQLPAAVTFAALFVLVALASSWVRGSFGRPGVYLLGAVAGVTDIDPFVLNLAQGSVTGMSAQSIGSAILIAASSNNVLKALYAIAFGGLRACLRPAVTLLTLAAAGVIVALLYLG